MNPARLLVLLVSLPLLLGGCGEKHEGEKHEGVNWEELEISGDIFNEIAYHKGSPYTGKSYELHLNGQKSMEGNYKDGKEDGLWVWWYENGQKMLEQNFKEEEGKNFPIPDGLEVGWHENGQKKLEQKWKEGNVVKGSEKFWNSKGEPVDSILEVLKE